MRDNSRCPVTIWLAIGSLARWPVVDVKMGTSYQPVHKSARCMADFPLLISNVFSPPSSNSGSKAFDSTST